MRKISIITSFLALSVLLSGPLQAKKLYKWVDEDGSVYYSDKVPPREIKREHKELSSTGVQLKHVGAAMTAEEIAKESQKELLREQQQVVLEQQQAKDNALLKTFRSIDDIIFSRDGKLATYDTQIKLSHQNIESLKTRLLLLQERAAQYERQGKKPAAKTLKSIDNTQNEIRDTYSSILRREKGKEIIVQEYDDSITRFRELKNLKTERISQSKTQSSADINATDFSLVETAVICDNTRQCDQFWETAKAYGMKHATTGIQLNAPKIYLSKPANENTDISVTVSRVRPLKDGKEVIFMDMSCKATLSGIELCQSKALEKIRSGFRPSVLGKK